MSITKLIWLSCMLVNDSLVQPPRRLGSQLGCAAPEGISLTQSQPQDLRRGGLSAVIVVVVVVLGRCWLLLVVGSDCY